MDPSSNPPKGKPTYPDPSPGPTGRYLFRRRGGRGTRYGGFSGFGNQYRMQPFTPQPAYDTQPSNFYSGQSNQMPVMTQMQAQCPKCGGMKVLGRILKE